MPLDPSLLRWVRHVGDRIVAQCPACADTGGDQHGKNHLVVWSDGRFACVAHPGDREHRRRIWELAGDRRARPPVLNLPLRTLLRLARR